jgi:glutamate-1-semialdehyde 2,1-aminomutase
MGNRGGPLRWLPPSGSEWIYQWSHLISTVGAIVLICLAGQRSPEALTLAVTTRSHELLRRASQVLPDAAINAWVMRDEVACVISRGSGSHIYDCDGNEYIDWVVGSGPGILGHCHPAVIAALEAQLAKGPHFYALSEPTIELAEMLTSAIPCAELVKFTSSGAEATFQALRMARAFTGREKIMRFAGSYHGHHDYAQVGLSAGVPDAIGELVVTGTYNDVDEAAALIERHGAELAAVIVEPFQRVTPPRDGFLSTLRQLTADAGIVLIFDELVTGFRLAWGGGQERYGIIPDLATYGKIIGGGLPLGAIVGRGEIIELSSPRRPAGEFAAGSGTLNGNALAASAGLATLRTLQEPRTYEKLARTGQSLIDRFNEIAAASELPLQVLGDHALIGLCFGEGDPFDPATPQRGDVALRNQLEIEFFKRGVFVNLPAAGKLYFSTEHDDADVENTAAALEHALEVLEQRDLKA